MVLPFQLLSAEIACRDDEFTAGVGMPIINQVTLSVKNVVKPFTPAQQARLDGLNAQLADLQERVTRAEIQMEALRELIYNGVDVAGNETVLSALKADIAVLQPQMATVRSQIKALKDQVTVPQVKIATNFFLLPKEIILGRGTERCAHRPGHSRRPGPARSLCAHGADRGGGGGAGERAQTDPAALQ